MSSLNRFSRRSLIVATSGLALAGHMRNSLAQGSTLQATPAALWSDRPDPIDLGSGIVITDIRIVSDGEPAYFLIEVENRREESIDAPTIGAILPHAADEHSFIVATPWYPVMPPGTSTFGAGFLPTSNTTLDGAEWVLCNPAIGPGELTQSIARWSWELTSDVEVSDESRLHVASLITNTGSVPLRTGEIRGIVRDQMGRICGGLPLTNMYNLQPGATVDRTIGMNRSWNSPVNPFLLCNSAYEMSVSLQVQPRAVGTREGCPSVMPWNR